MRMKSITKFACLTMGVIGACAVMTGCGGDKQSSRKFTKDEFYGVGAVSCAEILASTLNVEATATFAALAATADGDIKGEAETFNKYFNALNSVLDDSAMSVKTEENTDGAYSQFAAKLTVKGRDIAGNATEYIMYFNETAVGASGKESTFTLDGVMLTGGTEYRLTGGKEIETENGEREEEL